MRLTRRQLREIIKEELTSLSESSEHDAEAAGMARHIRQNKDEIHAERLRAAAELIGGQIMPQHGLAYAAPEIVMKHLQMIIDEMKQVPPPSFPELMARRQ